MIKLVLFTLAIIAFSAEAEAVDCKRHKIYCKILEMQPRLDKKYAMKISNLIYKYRVRGIDTDISVAIASAENNFLPRTVEETVTTVRTEITCFESDNCKTDVREKVKHLKDIGLFQINNHTARRYKLNEFLLMTDIEYNVKAHFLILKKSINICKRIGIHTNPWSCYHSATPKHRKRYERVVLEKLRGKKTHVKDHKSR